MHMVCIFNDECTLLEWAGSPQNGIQSTQQQQAAASVINSGANMQQPSASQQPIQFQNIAGPGQTSNEKPQLLNMYDPIAPQQSVQFQSIAGQRQTSFNANPPPPYYEEYPYTPSYLQDPIIMANAMYNIPQPYGGNYYLTPQQVHVIPMHEAVCIIHCISYIHVCVADFSKISPARRSNNSRPQS